MIEAMIDNKFNYLIKGVQLLPQDVSYLIKKYPEKIKCCYIGFTTISVEQKISELNMYQDKLTNNWFKHFSEEEMIINTFFLM